MLPRRRVLSVGRVHFASWHEWPVLSGVVRVLRPADAPVDVLRLHGVNVRADAATRPVLPCRAAARTPTAGATTRIVRLACRSTARALRVTDKQPTDLRINLHDHDNRFEILDLVADTPNALMKLFGSYS